MNGASRDHDEMLDLIAIAALGSLERQELAVVSLHLLSCDDCRAEYASLREVSTAIGFTAEAALDEERSVQMRDRLHALIGAPAAVSASTPARRMLAPATWAAWFVAAAALVFAFFTANSDHLLRRDVAAGDARLGRSNARIAATDAQAAQERRRLIDVAAADARANRTLRAEIAARDRTLAQRAALLTAATTRVAAVTSEVPQSSADLTATDAQRYPIGFGTIIRRGERLYVALTALPPIPAGKVYETWTVMKGAKLLKLTPGPTFTPSRDGTNVLRLPVAASKVIAVAVTVEPQGGSRIPTSKPLFLRRLS